MKKCLSLVLTLILLLAAKGLLAQGTAFTYQGELIDGATPANGSYDMRLSLFNTLGNQIGDAITDTGVGVTNGLFTITVDFGQVFAGSINWLQIDVRTNGGSSFTPLNPRQQLTPAPYAIFAEGANAAGLSGTVALAQLPVAVGLVSDPGSANFFAGQVAGNAAVTGIENSGLGGGALNAITSGSQNAANGYDALNSNQTGAGNTASGAFALGDNGSGSENTAVGAAALGANLTGSNNVAVGYEAIQNNRTDNGLVAVGYQALQNDAVVGSYVGSGANSALGYQALQLNTTGSGNTGVGFQALNQNTFGYNNTAAGFWALLDNTSGNEDTAYGALALARNTIGTENTAIGDGALGANQTGNGNAALGVTTLQANTAGNGNTAIGSAALFSATGNNNIVIGNGGGDNLTSGSGNIDIGSEGNSGDNAVIRIGTPGNQTSAYIAGKVGINAALNIDQTGTYGQNGGNVNSNALTFGTGPGGSGEGIASQRTSGPGQFDLALYTGFLARLTILASGNVGIGTAAPQDTLDVNGITRTHSIIITGGADLAEPFPMTQGNQPIAEGQVVVIDEANPGQLKLTARPYDTRVAGVVSGANGIHPGIQMQQQGLLEGARNVALTGRVYVQADASNGAIHPGDLLTTSSTPGRAMKVTDHARAQGAILGKAMTDLKEGKGMVLALVTLQ